MGLKVKWLKHTLNFKFKAGTSRGFYTEKDSFFIKVYDSENLNIFGLGEAAPLKGLSIDDLDNFEEILDDICRTFNQLDLEVFEWNLSIILTQLIDDCYPSIKFAFETALLDFMNGGQRIIFNNGFVKGEKSIPINGLVWMGDKEFMNNQVSEKLRAGFGTIKIKVGAINFEEELSVLSSIRKEYSAEQITLRVDANGAFSENDVWQKLEKLSDYQIHSIEQPIKQGNPDSMKALSAKSPIPIALDEELIGVSDYVKKMQLLKHIQPQYIILKPTLLGGLQHCKEWIEIATRLKIGWWMTSALESNIGLNAIAQLTAQYKSNIPQGLGTGELYHNNIESPLEVKDGNLHYQTQHTWNLGAIF